MRTRAEIEKYSNIETAKYYSQESRHGVRLNIVIEVLLDIRDLLQKDETNI